MSKPKKRRMFQFTPEQEKQFNQVTVPGTNVNSNTTDARKTGVQAQNFQAQEAARRDAEIEARSDRKTVKRQTTVGERLRGDNGYSSYMSAGTPMSGRDPVLGTIFDWTVGAKGIDALGKTALWNYAKYVPTSELGKWGRNYFINNAFKQELRKPIQFGVGETLQPQVRTKLGDVEIDNPGLNYRVGTKEIVKDFQNSGVVRAGEVNSQKPNRAGRFLLTKETFQAPMFKQGSLWYQPSEEMNGLLVTSEPLVVANKYASPVANKGIFTIEGKTFANDFGGRRIPAEGQILNKSNTTAYTWSPGYGYKQVVEEPSTSLKFFERKPSRISFAERLGIPKGDRGNLNQFQKDALEDLEYYIKQGQYRQSPSMINGNIVWGRTINTDPETLQLLSHTFRSPLYKGAGVRANLRNNFNFDVSVPSKDLNGGEATLHSYDSGSGKFILTSPKTAASIGENDFFTLENAPETLPKSGMKTFWTVVQETRKPGTYFSGDFNREPLGSNLIREFKNNKAGYIKDNYGNETKILPHRWDGILKELFKPQKWFNRGDNGLSTDSYLALLKQAKRKDSPYLLRYSPDGAQFNDRGVENKFIYDLLEKTKTGEATQQEFLDAFHNWVSPYGGMDARIINGEIVIPHPFLYKKKQGGKLKINNTEI